MQKEVWRIDKKGEEITKKLSYILQFTDSPKFIRSLLSNICHTTKSFTEHLLAIEMKKNEILMIKSVYLGLSVGELSKLWMYEFFMTV